MTEEHFNIGATQYCQALQPGSRNLIQNVDTRVTPFATEGFAFPTTINDDEWDNSYVCSPYTALHGYCLEELHKVENTAFRIAAAPLIRLIGRYMKNRDINKNVHINNWLLSTNLYPSDYEAKELSEATQSWSKAYPEHAFIFRSLNEFSNARLLQQFKNADYLLMPSRQVYLYDERLANINNRHNFRIDTKLLKRKDYHYVSNDEILDSDLDRIVELYNHLYIAKYSRFNPMFTQAFIAHIKQNPMFELYGFRNNDGILDAIGGRFSVDSVTTLPIVGYDTGLPKSLALYRRVLIATNVHALENNLTFNASSGASHFKMLRGAEPCIEYSAVYVAHLSKRRRRTWQLVANLLNKIGVPIIKKYQL